MTLTKEMLYYDCISEFKRQFYKDALTKDNLVPQKIEIKRMNLADGTPDEEYNFRGWELVKDDIKYLVSDTIGTKQIQIKDILPIKPSKINEVGAKGLVYSHIKKPITLKFREQQTLTMKELIDFLSSLEHSNPTHQKLNWFKGLTSLFYRYNDRTSTPPGFGKDSTVDILGNLIGRCGTIESPTLAKLEERSTILKWLAVNEVIDIEKGQWRIIEQYLLATGAHKPEITKHSRGYGGVGEIIDLSDLSLSLMYNDITNYPDKSKYFDYISKTAITDRFPAFRLWGTFKENFNTMHGENIQEFIAEHLDDYKEIIYNITYYQNHLNELLHGYDRTTLIKMSDRWATNLGRLLNVIDVYCDSQEEFDGWIEIINNSIIDYKAMLSYCDMLELFKQKLKIPQTKAEKIHTISQIISFFEPKQKTHIHEYNSAIMVKNLDTFSDKIRFIDAYKEEEQITDVEFW